MKTTYVYDTRQKKMVEKHKRTDTPLFAIHTMAEFVSPIDGSVISSPAGLRAHNRKHGVTDSRDYSPEFLKKAQSARMSVFNDKEDRLNDLNRAYEAHRD